MLAATSETYIRSVSLEKRKQLGQYMTPAVISLQAAQTLGELPDGARVLDPAVGTGELLLAVKATYPNQTLNLTGWDVDDAILEQAVIHLPEADLTQRSLFTPLGSHEEGQFDAIIANPPYFEIKKDHSGFNRNDWAVAEGRPNIYALFFEYALKLLKPEGRMVFIVPPSMNAGAYYTRLRSHLLSHGNLEHLSLVRNNNEFLDALTSVQIITFQKTENGTDTTTNQHLVDFTALTGHGPTVFTDQKTLIEEHWQDADSLWNAGYQVATGSVCWNHHKEAYVPSEEHTEAHHPLLYSKDISKNQTLAMFPALSGRRWLTLPAANLWNQEVIIVNRIVGSLNNPAIRAAIVDGTDIPFYGENHLNIISPRPGVPQTRTLAQVHEALTDTSKLTSYLKALTGNTQLSARELEHLIPIPK